MDINENERIWRIIVIIHTDFSAQPMVFVIECYLDAVIDFLLKIRLLRTGNQRESGKENNQ
jgi:hypothetical protein